MGMAYEAVIFDFDGTLTRVDVLDHLAGCSNKQVESARIRADFQTGKIDGITCLVQRVSLLDGLALDMVKHFLNLELLRSGYRELQAWLHKSGLRVLLVSGNICPVLQYYAGIFNAEMVFCTAPEVHNGKITGLNPQKVGKKTALVNAYLSEHGIRPEATIAIGDDRSDIPFFDLCGWSIAFNADTFTSAKAKQSLKGNLTDLRLVLQTLQKGEVGLDYLGKNL